MYFFRILFTALLLSIPSIYAEEAPYREEILIYAEMELPHHGILKHKPSTGLIYLDVSDDYITELVKFVEADGFLDSTCLDGPNTIGAHISVISGKEARSLESVEELGQEFFFILKDCIKVQPATWKAVDELYILVVEAPELDVLRKKYGLPPKPHEFHITIGVEAKSIKGSGLALLIWSWKYEA